MILTVDSGYDEINDNLFQVIVFDKISGETFCHVFGKTIEECEERANNLVYAYNTHSQL